MLKSQILLSLSLALVLAACSNQSAVTSNNLQNATGIIGGEAAKATDPVTGPTVSLVYVAAGFPQSFCTGTLISENLVLTATHCLQDMDISDIQVYFGEILPTSLEGENFRAIKSAVTHPEYKFDLEPNENVYTGFNDVGLVMLESEAPAFAKPVAVLNDTTLTSGQSLLLAGFGLVNEISVPPVRATGLNLTRVTVAKTYANIIVTEQSAGNGACAGDSGGPAYLETENGLVVLGITRGPYNLAKDCRHWGEYTYASKFKDYILMTAKDM